MIEEAINKLLKDDVNLQGLVSDRIYPMHLPQAPTYPAIAYTRISTTGRDLSHGGAAKLAEPRFQIGCFADTLLQAKQTAARVRQVLHGYQGAVVVASGTENIFDSRVVNEVDLFDPDLGYQVAVDILIYHRET